MSHPRIGGRAFVRPTCPSVRVQRGEGLYTQFIPPDGADLQFDEYLLRRLHEGVITATELPPGDAPTGKESA